MDDDTEDGFGDLASGIEEDNFYAFLNISKDATADEINTAYRNQSRIYHPDKHVNVELKHKAELLFNRTKRAYEVLSDPHQRAIYDSLGIRGLQTEGWEIVHRTKTPQEIREEYERLARDREERRLQQRTNPKGNITINVNATEIFDAYQDEFDEPPPFPSIEVSGMSISQSIEAPMTTRDTVTMSGSLSSHNGVGNGAFIISGRRLINKGWLALDVGAGNGPVLGVKGSRTLSQRVFCNGGATLNFRRNGVIPGLVGTLGVQLGKHTVGYLTYNAGPQSSMSTILEHSNERQHFSLTCTLGVPHSFLSANYTRKMIEHELKLKLAAKIGTFGFIAEYGAEKKVTKYSSVFASVSVGVPTGVTLKIKVIRSSQSYIFPIHLSEEIVPAAVFYATVTPLLAWFVIKKTIVEPMHAEHRQRKLDKIRETHKQRIAEKRKEAEAAIDLMAALYERICDEERQRHGLIIVSARYGRFDDDDGCNVSAVGAEADDRNATASAASTPDSSGSDWSSAQRFHREEATIIDVTLPLQCLTRDSRLKLQKSSKAQLPGFYDPCVGEPKVLRIDYMYRDVSYTVEIKDEQELRLPNDDT